MAYTVSHECGLTKSLGRSTRTLVTTWWKSWPTRSGWDWSGWRESKRSWARRRTIRSRVRGVTTEDGEIVIIECRRLTTSRINQEDMGGIAYRIGHVGAAGGIVVTPIGVQEGARKTPRNTRASRLFASMPTRPRRIFMLEFLDKVIAGEICEVRRERHSHCRGRSRAARQARAETDVANRG